MIDKALAGIAGAAPIIGGQIVVAQIVAPAPGILGVLGVTTTTAVTVPVAGAACVAAAVGYGAYLGVCAAQKACAEE